MSDIWKILEKTGGPHDLRVAITSTLNKIDGGAKKDMSIHSFRALYKMMEDFVESSKSTDVSYINKSIQLLYNGSISGNDLETMVDLVLTTKIGPSSSVEIDSRYIETVKIHKSNTTRIMYAIYAMFILFIPYVYFQNTGESYSRGVQEISQSVIRKESPVQKKIMVIDSFDIPTPFLLHVPPNPSRCLPPNDRLLQTPFIEKDKLSQLNLNRYGSRDRTNIYDTTFDNYREKFVKDSVRKVQTDGYELNVRGETKDTQIKEVSMWIEYVLSAVDPAYSPSGNQKLTVLLSDTFPQIDKKVFGAIGGLYIPEHDLLYVSKTEDKNEDRVKLDERGRQLMILVHEMAHRVHLVSDPIGMECVEQEARSDDPDPFKGVCKERAVNVNTEKTREYLNTVRDEVYGVVFLGVKSDHMTLEEASIYLKMILDIRIDSIYEKSKESKIYEKYRYEYAFTNHREFWAEASTSFLYTINPRNFPGREWIQENDPELYSVLSEVYSGASKYIVPEFFSFAGKMNPDPNDP